MNISKSFQIKFEVNTFCINLCDGSPKLKSSSTMEKVRMHAVIGSLNPNAVRWKLGWSKPVERRVRCDARKFSRDSNLGESTSPFSSFATNDACCILLRLASVSRPSRRQRSGYDGRFAGSLHGKCRNACRINRFCTRSTRRLHVSWWGPHTKQAVSSIGRTSE